MRSFGTLSVAVLGLALSSGIAFGQAEGPAELPPSSFTGKQYVDSQGCVYVRAGFDGSVTWVPRVARNRKVICGMTPTFGGASQQAAQTEAPVAGPAPAPAATQTRVPTSPRVAVADTADPVSPKSPRVAAPFQRVPEQVSPKSPRPVHVARTPRKKKVRKVQQVRAYAAPQPRYVQAQVHYAQPQVSNCVRYSANSTKRTHFHKLTPRCHPQAASPYGQVKVYGGQYVQGGSGYGHHQTQRVVQGGHYGTHAGQVVTDVHVTDEVVVEDFIVQNGYAPIRQPKIQARRPTAQHHDPHFGNPRPHVHNGGHLGLFRKKPTVAIVGTPRPVRVPHGYRPLWQDDRLNRYRAFGTAQGDIEMKLVWSSTVPRRLIDSKTGRDVTALYPNVIYPYPAAPQQGYPLPNAGYAPGYPAMVAGATGVKPRGGFFSKRARAQKAAPQQARVSTRAVATQQAARAATHRFVQVGVFSNANGARNAIARLQATGMSVRTGSYQRGGKTLQIVLAGPFASQSQLQNGLATAKRAGFRNASLRK